MSLKDALYEKFTDIPSRKGPGGTYSYVRWQDVADRMNTVFDTNWSSEVVYQDVVGNNVIVRVKVTIFDENSRAYHQEGFGGAPNNTSSEAGNPFKSAYSKALKDACKKWGIGLFIEDEGEDYSSGQGSVIPNGFVGKEFANPQHFDAKPTPQFGKPMAPVEPKRGFEPAPPVERSVGASVATGGMQMPAGVSMTAMSTQAKTFQQPFKPNVSLKEDMPMSKVSTITTDGVTYISNVQKAALTNILNIGDGIDYNELVKEAFTANGYSDLPVPGNIDNLTYQQAVMVIKYGNDKFRRR